MIFVYIEFNYLIEGDDHMFKKIFKKKLAFSMLTAILIGALVSSTVFAIEDTGVTVTGDTLSGGDLTFADFGGITLSGIQQATTATWNIADVVDSRGTGAGWNVVLTLTQLAEYDTVGFAYVASGKTLGTSSIKVTTAPIVTLADATSSDASTVTPVATAVALDTGTPVKLLSAAIDGGMGSYAIAAMTATLTTRADTYAGTFKTDATVAMVTGP